MGQLTILLVYSDQLILFELLLCIFFQRTGALQLFAGQNHLFKNKFFHIFPSLTEKKNEKRKESTKITRKTCIKWGSTSV